MPDPQGSTSAPGASPQAFSHRKPNNHRADNAPLVGFPNAGGIERRGAEVLALGFHPRQWTMAQAAMRNSQPSTVHPIARDLAAQATATNEAYPALYSLGSLSFA